MVRVLKQRLAQVELAATMVPEALQALWVAYPVSRSDTPYSSSLRGRKRCLVRKTLAQRTRSSILGVGRQATWGMSGSGAVACGYLNHNC
jgi:hypothetical protein